MSPPSVTTKRKETEEELREVKKQKQEAEEIEEPQGVEEMEMEDIEEIEETEEQKQAQGLGESKLHSAAERGDLEMVRELPETQGVDVDARDACNQFSMADTDPDNMQVDQNVGRGFEPVDALAADVEGLDIEDELANLPRKVQLRVEALRELQDQQAKIAEEFEKERKLLELKYKKLYQPLYVQRAEIVSGTMEVAAVTNGEGLLAEEAAEDVKGVPGFWARALMNHSEIADMIFERDLPALEFLIDVRSTSHENDNGFKLEFEFAENPVFTNKVLTKEYDIGEASDSGEAVLRNVIGTPIEWKEGQNLCEVTKKVEHRAKGSKETRVVSRTEPCESFFQFFTPVEMPSEDDQDSDIIMRQLSGDFEIGFTIHESIVPQALLWFTGEAVEEDSEYDPEDDEEYDEDDDEESDDDDEDDDNEDDDDDMEYDDEDVDDDEDDDDDEDTPTTRKGKKKFPALDGNSIEKPPECNNQ